MSLKTLFIIRGLPGTGKTTLAYQLTMNVAEADQFFHGPGGVGPYQFDQTKLKEAHKYCEDRVLTYMRAGCERIAVSNTGSQRWEFAKYEEAAKQFGYKVTEITLTGQNFGSVHNVPEEAFTRMKDRWEK